jgi:hypothetical protein
MANDDLTVGKEFDEGALPNPSQTHDGDDDIFFTALALAFDFSFEDTSANVISSLSAASAMSSSFVFEAAGVLTAAAPPMAVRSRGIPPFTRPAS